MNTPANEHGHISTPESVFLTTWALAMQAIRNRGQAEALAILDAMEAGRAHVSLHVELSAGACHILASLCEAGQVDPLLRVSLDTSSRPQVAH